MKLDLQKIQFWILNMDLITKSESLVLIAKQKNVNPNHFVI